MKASTKALLAVGAVGLALRFVLAVVFFGTNDMEAWTTFGEGVATQSLCFVYGHVAGMFGQFNHPPLMAELAGGLWWLAATLGVPYALAFKLVPVACDCATALLIFRIVLRQRGERAAAIAFVVYAFSLVSMLIAGVHGNSDATCLFLCLLAYERFERRAFFAAGVALAIALNVKLIPVIVLIALVLQVRSAPALLRLALGLSLGLLPLLLVRDCGSVFLEKVVAYVPHRDSWGVLHFLSFLRSDAAKSAAVAFADLGRFVPLVGAVLCGLIVRQRRLTPFHAAAATFAVFLVGAVGFGVQYLVYLAPFACLVSCPWGFAYTTLAGVFVACVYAPFTSAHAPYVIHMFGRIGPRAAMIGVAVWTLALLVLVRVLVAPSVTTRQHDE